VLAAFGDDWTGAVGTLVQHVADNTAVFATREYAAGFLLSLLARG
jgi:hypothetical protein